MHHFYVTACLQVCKFTCFFCYTTLVNLVLRNVFHSSSVFLIKYKSSIWDLSHSLCWESITFNFDIQVLSLRVKTCCMFFVLFVSRLKIIGYLSKQCITTMKIQKNSLLDTLSLTRSIPSFAQHPNSRVSFSHFTHKYRLGVYRISSAILWYWRLATLDRDALQRIECIQCIEFAECIKWNVRFLSISQLTADKRRNFFFAQ